MQSRNVSRRDFVWAVSTGVAAVSLQPWTGLAAPGNVPASLDLLPVGASPQPVEFRHFPDRLHAFIWRNWTLVPINRLAKVIGAKPREVLRIGKAMGLSDPGRVTADQEARSYITVIKRNWHLLPYEQLLQLLGWTAEQLAFTLREDDFLYIKLGSLKPHCERLVYRQPDEPVRARERAMARILEEEGITLNNPRADPLFGFVERFSQTPRRVRRSRSQTEGLRYCYSYFALYGDPLVESDTDPYPEGYLARLAEVGVTGVWLQAVLHKLADFPWDENLSKDKEMRLKNLRRLVARARRHGLSVFLYLNEPRSHPLRFFERYPALKGTVEGDHAAMCTSLSETRQYLAHSLESICQAVPDLGGFFTITASENFTNCWSHGGGAGCPRCGLRTPAEVIAEVNGAFAEGIRNAGSAARLIAWDWGWNDAWAGDLIRRLPREVSLMSVSEWRLPIERGGVKTEVGEYSISAVGPGPRAREHWKAAQECGLRTLAKVQAGNTWELSSVPYIPALENVARHAEALGQMKVQDFMLGWTLGGYPSPNLEVFSETLATGSAQIALQRVAERRFGEDWAAGVVQAWHQFSLAFSEFPYHIGVVYSGPQQLGPANLLWEKPTGFRATMVGFPYDDLEAWRSVYPAEVFIRQLEKVADGFEAGLATLQKLGAETGTTVAPALLQALDEECHVSEAAAIHFRSAAAQARFVLARRQLAAAQNATEASAPLKILEGILRLELELARRLHQLQLGDSRLGFEASNHYFYVPADLAEKVLNVRYLLDHWLMEQRKRFPG